MSWVEFKKSWHDTSVDNCDVCGNLLINRYWEFTHTNGRTYHACRQDDEQLLQWLDEQRQRPGYADFSSLS
jgi:hypothetical protein